MNAMPQPYPSAIDAACGTMDDAIKRIAELEAALRLALPYVQKVASTVPTEMARVLRQRQASKDVSAIRAALRT